ncbi:hypothetical protein [Streptomyces tailanensis]|uniref:hypothetical protein n=1 Tax=Streptomyces tailanensis TaxID=2569858 RepID=UPI00122E52AC|nr:hypothetical protein [Streptomyces tailanensis]
MAPAHIPGILRTVLTGTQIYSGDDISDALGMTVIRLHPEGITPALEPEQGQALSVLRALPGPGDDENPFLIGFLMKGTVCCACMCGFPAAPASSAPTSTSPTHSPR